MRADRVVRTVAPTARSLPDLVDQWLRAGVITSEQAERMRVDLPASRPRRRQRQGSLAVEALGYFGSVLVVVASVLLASQYWDELPTYGHLLLVGGAAALLLGCGFAVPQRIGTAGVRLRAALWLAATIATSGFLVVLGDEVLKWYDEDLALLVFAGVTTCAAVLWWRQRSVVQQAAVFAGLAGMAGAAMAQFGTRNDLLPGLGVWAVGAVWFGCGWGAVIKVRWAALVLGAAGLLVGSGMTASTDVGVVLGLATVVALVTLAVVAHDLLVLGLGAWGALQIVPMAVNRWFPSELAAAGALLAAGVVLVLIALWVAHRRRAEHERWS